MPNMIGLLSDPNALDAHYPPIFEAARFALTGNSQSTKPTDEILTFPARLMVRDLLEKYPCTGNKDTLSITLTGTDLEHFHEAAGYAVAAALLQTPQGGEYAQKIYEIRIGPVTKKIEKGVILEAAQKWLQGEYDKSLGAISCIAAALAKIGADSGGLFRLAGHGRGRDSRCGSPLFNGNRGGWG